MSIARPLLPALAVAAALTAPAAFAQTPLDSDWVVRIGAYFPSYDTVARADARDGIVGTSVRFEDTLGLRERGSLPMLDATWRIAGKHRIEASYLDLQRDATQTLTASVTWEGQTYSASTRVKSQFDSQILAVSYLYSPYRTKDTELSAGLGVHTAKFTAGVARDGVSVASSGTVSARAPLPVVALRGMTRVAPNVYADLRYQWFGLKYDDYKGRLNVMNAAVSWHPWRNAGIELGYGLSDYDLKVSREEWRGEARYRFHGPSLSLIGTF